MIVPTLALAVTACSGDARTPVYPVKGKVVYKSRPAEGAMVVLHKVGEDPKAKAGIKPFGQTGADGTFQMNYYNTGDGVPEGEYVATVVWPAAPPPDDPDQTGPDRLKGRYADPRTSKWRVKVGKAPQELEPFTVD